jgi:hypothetical protein
VTCCTERPSQPYVHAFWLLLRTCRDSRCPCPKHARLHVPEERRSGLSTRTSRKDFAAAKSTASSHVTRLSRVRLLQGFR